MKPAIPPLIRVAADSLQEIEGVLEDDETISQFIQGAPRSVGDKREHQTVFVQRGKAAIQETQRTGNGIPAEQVLARLEARLRTARQMQTGRSE
jgi:hypothetical protein